MTGARENAIARVKAIDAAIDELASGAQSATFSTPNGSETYTRPQLHELVSLRKKLVRAIRGRTNMRTQPDFSE